MTIQMMGPHWDGDRHELAGRVCWVLEQAGSSLSLSFLSCGTDLAHMLLRPKVGRIGSLLPVTSDTSVSCWFSVAEDEELTPTLLD